jgi:hypothetical protein
MNSKSENERQELVKIQPFSEYIGKLTQVERKDSYVTLFLSFNSHGESKLIFSVFSPEAKLLAEQLEKLVGKKVGILKTDNPLHPYLFRVIDPKSVNPLKRRLYSQLEK